jgi:hypothetical protein
MCPKYCNLLIVGTVSRECLGLIWLITFSFVVLTDHGTLCNLQVHNSNAAILLLCTSLNNKLSHLQSTAVKTAVCTTLIFCAG